MADSNLKALSSGRMDPVHPGHIINIIRMAKRYKSLKYVILNDRKRDFPIAYCLPILTEIFEVMNLDVTFIVNKTHFGEIGPDELNGYGCDIYVGGNKRVLRHIETLDFPVCFFERAFDYTARDIPRPE